MVFMSDTMLKSIWQNPIHFIACGFGLGAIPIMPGTFGTLFGVLVYLMLDRLPLIAYLIITLVLIVLGVFLCGRTNRDFGVDDHPAAVWDEIASFPIVMIAIPFQWYYLWLGFILFRLFDIWKPWPIRWVDKNIHSGIGVMLDDVIAAIFSWVVLYIVVLIVGET
jgi:phosphatidylglycerophosphatase A